MYACAKFVSTPSLVSLQAGPSAGGSGSRLGVDAAILGRGAGSSPTVRPANAGARFLSVFDPLLKSPELPPCRDVPVSHTVRANLGHRRVLP